MAWQDRFGRRQVGGNIVAEIMTSPEAIVFTWSFVWPLQQDLMVSHAQGVGKCIPRYCRKGRQLDLGESGYLTRISLKNLEPVSNHIWVNACRIRLGLMAMMVIVMIVTVIVMVRVTAMMIVTVIILNTLSPICWLCQHQCQIFNRLNTSIGQSFHQCQV